MKSIIRLVAMAAIAMLMTAMSPANATIAFFGRTTIGSTPSGGLRADFKRGSKVVLPEKAVMVRICAYLDGNGGGTGSQAVRFALYRDRNGLPAEQVLETVEEIPINAFSARDWRCRETARAPLDPGTYWLMIHSGQNPGVIRYFHDGPANWYGNADVYGDGASDNFGSGGAGEGTLSIQAQYFPESEVRFAGARNIGTRVSSPMSANMKRGSSFVLTESASLFALSAYIDSFGGASGSQPLWIGVYQDTNGEPSALIARGNVTAEGGGLNAGRSARWVSATRIDGNRWLTPGRYWIVLHTGGPAGVFRYYLEGTGNWRGNANPGAVPPVFFGPANPGDGTITAHALFGPVTFANQTFGRATPGNVPSGAMTANYIRGARFVPDHNFVNGWVTALWAYVDGNGGASGSQKLKLALYRNVPGQSPLNRMTFSEEITIPAGTQPGWVRFAVPYTFITYSPFSAVEDFHVMLFSGGTQGVARYYSGNDADNWRGAPATYSSSAPDLLYLDQGPPGATVLLPGTRTPSIYVEYLDTDELPRT